MAKAPLDATPYPRDPSSRPIVVGIPDGNYVYVQSSDGTIFVLDDGPHRHPLVLGNAEPARYAGDLRIAGGLISDLTNLSGTFQFDDPGGLLEVYATLIRMGFRIAPGAVRYFPVDGRRPVVLR